MLLVFLVFALPYSPGEKISYDGFFGWMKVGSSWMKIEKDSVSNEDIYIIESQQKTEGFFRYFFPLEDRYISHVRAEDFSSLSFKKNINEGDYSNEVKLTFTEDSVKYSDGRRVKKIEGARDIFAAIYSMRNFKLQSGDTLYIPFHSSGQNSTMEVPVKGPLEVTVPAGEYRTYILSPDIEGASIFNSEKPVKIYISVDSLHIPVKLESELEFGKISFELSEYMAGKRED